MLNEYAPIHGDTDAGGFETACGREVFHPELHEEKRDLPGDRLVRNRGHVLGTPEDVHNIDTDFGRDPREAGVAGLPQDFPMTGVDRNDPVPLPLEVPRDLVGGAQRIGRTTDDGDRLRRLERLSDAVGLVQGCDRASSDSGRML